MDVSKADSRLVACPYCGQHVDAQIWRIIDAEHRPDLLALLEAGQLGALTCPRCDGEGQVSEPLLIWRPQAVPPILYVPSPDSALAESNEAVAELVVLLRERADPASQPRTWTAVMTPRGLIGEVIRRDAVADLRRLTASEPLEVDDDRYRMFLGYVGRYLEADSLQEALELFLKAFTWDEALAVLREHPKFATSAGEQLLADEIAAAQARGDTSAAELHREHLTALRRFGDEVPDGMPGQPASTAPLGPQSELRAAVREIDALQDDTGRDPRHWLALHERAIALIDRERDPLVWARLETGLARARLESAYTDRGASLELAITGYQSALAAWVPGEESEEWARVQGQLGMAYAERLGGSRSDNIERAIACYNSALTVFGRDRQPVEWAWVQRSLGAAYRRRIQGDRIENNEQALASYRRALEVYAEKGMSEEQGLTLANLGPVYLSRVQGDRKDNAQLAIRNLTEALRLLPLDQRQSRAIARNNLGQAYYLHGDRKDETLLSLALECFEAALDAFQKLGMPVKAAGVWCSLGSIYRVRQSGERNANIERAIAAYDSALKVLTPADTPMEWAMAQYNLGVTYSERRQGTPGENLARACSCLDAALTVYQPQSAPADCCTAAAALGGFCTQTREWPRAAAAYQIALDAAERLYQASLLRSGREAELSEVSGLYGNAAQAFARNGGLQAAVATLELGRARGAGDVLARDRVKLDQVRALDPDAYQAYVTAAARLAAVELAERSLIGTDTGDLADLRGRAREARGALADAISRIRQLAGHGNFLNPAGFAEVTQAARNGPPLAYLTTGPKGSMVFLIRQVAGDQFETEVLPAESFTMAELAKLLITRDGTRARGYLLAQLGATADLAAALDVILPAVGRALIAPLAARLRAVQGTAVSLVPCGLLSLLPLHAARYPGPRGETCLLDEFDVSFAPSARVLSAAQEELRTRRDTAPTLAGVGNPAPNPVPLAFAEAEVAEVASCFDRAVSLTGTTATKLALFDAASQASHVHLACHGRFELSDPLRSYLELAGDGEPDRLELREMLALRPFAAARLVVVSACETAIADFMNVPDESVGLPGAILEAGAPGVIGTLWPVDDLSSALIMTRFYEYHLHGRPDRADRATDPKSPAATADPMEPAQALRAAACWLRQLTGQQLAEYVERHPHLSRAAAGVLRFAVAYPDMRPYTSPYHWAPYVMVGA